MQVWFHKLGTPADRDRYVIGREFPRIAGYCSKPLGLAMIGGLVFSQVITLYITPVIYLYPDRYLGKGPVTKELVAQPGGE